MRELLEYMLKTEGYSVSCAQSGREAISMLEKDHFDLLLCDIRLGDITGLDVLRAAKQQHPDNVVIMISAYATTETAVEAMNEGAYDYVPKPFDKDELLATIAKALELRTIEHEKKQLDDELKQSLHFGMIVGSSPAMNHIYKLIEQVSKTKTNVLITGESGTGKEVIAKAIHQESDRSGQPFMVINCGGIPETLMESELFGHKKGAFTGATHDKKGLFEIAHKGTVFLDGEDIAEIAEVGTELTLDAEGVMARRFVSVYGPEWNWVMQVAPVFEIEGRRLDDFLAWISRETGRRVNFQGEETARSVSDTVLHGSIEGLTPEEALATVLPTCGLTHRVREEKILIGELGTEMPWR